MTTNLERIRQMTADELAEMLYKAISNCKYCPIGEDNCDDILINNCKDTIKFWLEQEVEE